MFGDEKKTQNKTVKRRLEGCWLVIDRLINQCIVNVQQIPVSLTNAGVTDRTDGFHGNLLV